MSWMPVVFVVIGGEGTRNVDQQPKPFIETYGIFGQASTFRNFTDLHVVVV